MHSQVLNFGLLASTLAFLAPSVSATPLSLELIKDIKEVGSGLRNSIDDILGRQSQCRALPGDKAWPSDAAWSQLNDKVGGRLIKTTPLASVCHDPDYNEAQCKPMADRWIFPETHFESSSSIVAPYFQNASCDPFTGQGTPCLIGNYPEYAIKVQNSDDIAAGLAFVQQNNLRLVIKNTGHDLLGRSTGKGSLSLWTHYLQDISISEYESEAYSGKAMKMGAGVQAFQAYEAASKAGLRVVGGTCPTVGLAGGYTQGGGHSMLSSLYGLGADQVLEWEVVTAEGKLVTATSSQNSDLYWALSGGGPGTYGVVISMTVKAWPDSIVTGAVISIFQGQNADDFWAALTIFHSEITAWIDEGAAVGYFLVNGALFIQPATFPGKSKDEVDAMLKPFNDKLAALQVSTQINVTSFQDYYTFFSNYFGPLPFGQYSSAQIQGGRLIPRDTISTKSDNQKLTDAFRTIIAHPSFHIVGVAMSVKGKNSVPNAVLPGWRDAIMTTVIGANWDYTKGFAANAVNEQTLFKDFDPLLERVTGSASGSYMNEGDFLRTDFASQYYGSNYPALKAIKKKYDPNDTFYGTTLVGSDNWQVDGTGRLCKK